MQDTNNIAYSPRQAAELSSLSLRSVMAAIACGELVSVKRGRRRLILREDLEAFVRRAGPLNRVSAPVTVCGLSVAS